jgi:hypothetical protein
MNRFHLISFSQAERFSLNIQLKLWLAAYDEATTAPIQAKNW